MENDEYIGNPVVSGVPPYDTGIMDVWGFENYDKNEKFMPGLHMICDLNGNGLKLNDVKEGMTVKIKGKRMHYDGFEYLYGSANSK